MCSSNDHLEAYKSQEFRNTNLSCEGELFDALTTSIKRNVRDVKYSIE